MGRRATNAVTCDRKCGEHTQWRSIHAEAFCRPVREHDDRVRGLPGSGHDVSVVVIDHGVDGAGRLGIHGPWGLGQRPGRRSA